MRGLVYACAILGMLCAGGGIADYYAESDGLLQLQTVPHLPLILITEGGALVVLGYLMFAVVVRRERRARKEAARKEEALQLAQRVWKRY